MGKTIWIDTFIEVMKNIKTKQGRAVWLQLYIQHEGAIPSEYEDIVRKLMDEVKEDG